MKQHRGFTVVELVIVVAVLGFAAILFFVQRGSIEVASRDTQRKTAINAMYYGLEEVYYPAHNSYPRTISSSVLPSVDPDLFTDPKGHKFGTSASSYSYTATNCTDNACASYTLEAHLEGEATYTKQSRHS